ncbi:MAG: thiamine phosphate synthase [Pseudomonadota bacterium]
MPPIRTWQIKGLYAVTPDTADTADLLGKVRQALAGGAALVQYRNKSATVALRSEQANRLQALCNEFGVPLIVNDDVALAAEVGAAGVHLGRDDVTVMAARSALGGDKIIGASCYNRIDLACQAAAGGADYVAFGSFFTSATKPQATAAPLELLRQAKRELALPVVAIGGITPANARQLIVAGADALAVITALFGLPGAPDVRAAAQDFSKMF